MTGYDLLKKIKESERLKDIPVVIMSSENIPSRISRCLEDGAEDFFLKPVQLSDVNKLKPHLLRSKFRNFCKLQQSFSNWCPDARNLCQSCVWKNLLSELGIVIYEIPGFKPSPWADESDPCYGHSNSIKVRLGSFWKWPKHGLIKIQLGFNLNSTGMNWTQAGWYQNQLDSKLIAWVHSSWCRKVLIELEIGSDIWINKIQVAQGRTIPAYSSSF